MLPDLQVPYIDERSLFAVEEVMAGERWDEVIQLGDFMDFDSISTHNAHKLKTVEGKTIQKDYDTGNEILDRWQRLAKGTKFTILEGNHDERMLRYLDANPALIGSLEVTKGLHLKKRGIQWVPYWSTGENYNIGNAYFIHGAFTNEHHAKKHVSRWGTNVFYGHTHDVQCFPLVLRGEDKTIVGQSLGCLCGYNQSYLQGRPTNWQQAFAAFRFFSDGFFSYEVYRIFKHRFVYGGQVFQG